MIARMLSVLTAVLAFAAYPTHAAEESEVKVSGDLVVHLGLLPAEMILGHRFGTEMHGGVPPGVHVYHVLVAVFEVGTGRRVDDVDEISAAVTGPVEHTPRQKLEWMSFAGEVGYGNYFDFPDRGPYQVVVRVRRRGGSLQEVTFQVKHVWV